MEAQNRNVRGRVRRLFVRSVVAMIAVLVACALGERLLEAHLATRVTVADTFVSDGDARIRYRLLGQDRTGPVVVLLHGIVGSLDQWIDVQDSISRFAPVLIYDRAGYGFSRGSTAHDAAQQADELARLLSALHLERRRVVVVGFSASASIARVFAGRYPERTAGMVLLAPYMPEVEGQIAGRHPPLRTYGPGFAKAYLTCFFGFKRITAYVSGAAGDSARQSLLDQKVAEILLSASHWLAAVREVLATDATARETAASTPPGDLPIIVINDPTDPSSRYAVILDGLIGRMVAGSSHGLRRDLPAVDHAALLQDPRSSGMLIGAIRDMVATTPRPATSTAIPSS